MEYDSANDSDFMPSDGSSDASVSDSGDEVYAGSAMQPVAPETAASTRPRRAAFTKAVSNIKEEVKLIKAAEAAAKKSQGAAPPAASKSSTSRKNASQAKPKTAKTAKTAAKTKTATKATGP